MELTQVRYVLAVYEARNFTRAAERCGVSQPSLTAAVKKLEHELGGPVFHRDRAGARLSPLGELLMPMFQRLAGEQQRVAEAARKYQLLDQAPLRVGVQRGVGPRGLAPAVGAFQSHAPGVEVEFLTHDRTQLLDRLEEGDVEVAIGISLPDPPGWLVCADVSVERYVVVLPPGHALVDKPALTLHDLHEVAYVDRLACDMRERLLQACAEADVRLYATYRTESEAWIEALVAGGIGIAVLPEFSVSTGSPLVIRPLVEPALSRCVQFWRTADHPLSRGGKAFWRCVKEAMADPQALER